MIYCRHLNGADFVLHIAGGGAGACSQTPLASFSCTVVILLCLTAKKHFEIPEYLVFCSYSTCLSFALKFSKGKNFFAVRN